ncbi:MAG: hypothetical protein KatS3mg076_2068 [Candidatus Binatia bacterium]|nr:MAG: hypothetical protein KatS3mg076_2068 [Candidatus Binatia bacterium]
MELDVRGHPLHTRSLTVELRSAGRGRVRANGRVLDLRKRGFVPVAADLQSSGVVHDMEIEAHVGLRDRTLGGIRCEQRAVAFEPSALTRGESCRDPSPRLALLEGVRLDENYAAKLAEAIGGTRGCTHILTLAHLLGATVAHVLASGGPEPREPGMRMFRRDVVVDGFEVDPTHMDLVLQMTDLRFRPAPPIVSPMQRFGSELEVRAVFEVYVPEARITNLRAATRARELENLESATWQDRSGEIAGLVGASLTRGIARRILEFLPHPGPLRDALLMMAPAFVQCAAGLSEAWPVLFKNSGSLVGMGGFPDSCYMWRRGGPLAEAQKNDEPPPRLW